MRQDFEGLEKRRGVVILASELAQDVGTDGWATMMRDIVIVHADRDYYTNAMNYICWSPHFRELVEGEGAPTYIFDPEKRKWNEVAVR